MITSIAFYLPQYHPCEENNIWWGKGFTEWTNVAKAKPLFYGHKQPNIPSELGFYDLRLEEVRIAQAELAKQAGISAFCYWHYWFGNGKRLLERPFNEVISSKNPDFPFCLAWANHSWYAKTWDKKGTKKLLIEQTYPGKDDFIAHFNELLPAFKDKRYLKYGNKPIFVVFKPLDIEFDYISLWNDLAIKNGFDGVYFIGQCSAKEKNAVLNKGYNAINREEIHAVYARHNLFFRATKRLMSRVFRSPMRYDYSNAMNAAWGGMADYNKIMVCMSNHKTTENIGINKEFTISIGDADHVVECDYVGIVSANKDPKKMDKSGFTTRKAEFVNAPIINEFPMTVECNLLKFNEDGICIGEIVNISADESVLGDDGQIDISKLQPISFDPVHHGYHVIGEKVGQAFSDGKELDR